MTYMLEQGRKLALQEGRSLGTGLGTSGLDFSVAFLIRDRALQASGPNPIQEPKMNLLQH